MAAQNRRTTGSLGAASVSEFLPSLTEIMANSNGKRQPHCERELHHRRCICDPKLASSIIGKLASENVLRLVGFQL